MTVSNTNYFEKSAILRASQAWNLEGKAEKEISDNYQAFLEQVKSELSTLYAEYSVEGILEFSLLKKKLTSTQLMRYQIIIQNIINQNSDIEDEELVIELNKYLEYTNLSVLDSKLNTIEVLLLVMMHKNIEIASESLSETLEFTYNHTLFDVHRKLKQILPFEKLTEEKIKEAIFSDWSGSDFAESIKYTRHMLMKDIKKSIVTGIRRNDSYQKIIKKLSELVSGGKGYKSIRKILRGETARIVAESIAESYEQFGIEKYQFIATLDNRTSETCRSLDMQVFNLSDREVGSNFPPAHFNCRSTVAPYIEGDDLSKQFRTARDPETNKNYKVKGNISFKEWNEKYN